MTWAQIEGYRIEKMWMSSLYYLLGARELRHRTFVESWS